MTDTQVAFQALVDLARQSLHSAAGLPAQVDIKPHWSGIGFELMGKRFVAPMGEVSEMLEVPASTRLPGVQPWVRGVANVRGRLLPLFDMGVFFGDQLSSMRKQHRVLILETEGLYSGLIVDRVFGMQHFPVDTYNSTLDDSADDVSDYVEGCYQVNGVEWGVFSPGKLAQEPTFLNAAKA